MALGGFTKIPLLQVVGVGEGGEPKKLLVLDEDGKGVGFLDLTVLDGYVPLSGTELDKPMSNVLYLSGSDGDVFGDLRILDDQPTLSQMDYYSENPLLNRVSVSSTGFVVTTELGGYIAVNINQIKGLLGNVFFNKQNDPKAFAQLGDIGTGFNQATLSTPQVLTALTPTVITLVGATEQENGGLDLLDISTNTITPIQQGDIITIDFAFPFETPAGTGHYGYIEIREKTTGFVVREFAKNFIKGAGIDDVFSASFVLPIGSASYVTNGFELAITTSVGITLDSKYVAVTRTHTKK